jgi:tricorn protease
MLGELNASHMGFYVRTEGDRGSSYTTMHPGFEIQPDSESGFYKVGHIYKKGPADKEWVDIKEGDYILSIDGRELKVPENHWKVLNHPLNERIDVVVSAEPGGEEKRTSTIKLTSYGSIMSLEYYEWVDANREKVDKLSNGRLAYAHIPGMSGRWLEKFKKEIIEFRLKEGLIIDVRNNGGGNIDQQLLDVLERRLYGKWVNRGSIPGRRPGNGFFGPKLVMINERSFSDAEVFPQGFRDLGLGKLVGVPTGGGVIATGSYRLMDGSTIRTPYVGVYTGEGINLENYGVKPDVYVEVPPEDELAGKDPQLERAVAELLSELPQPEEDKGEQPGE